MITEIKLNAMTKLDSLNRAVRGQCREFMIGARIGRKYNKAAKAHDKAYREALHNEAMLEIRAAVYRDRMERGAC